MSKGPILEKPKNENDPQDLLKLEAEGIGARIRTVFMLLSKLGQK